MQKFTVRVFPFETDDETERYKAVTQVVNDFIGDLKINNVPSGLGRHLLQVWQDDILINGSKRDASIQLNKKDIIWPILVYLTDINQCDEDFLNQFELGVCDEVVRLYGSTIDSCCERIEFFTRILYDYTKFPSTKKQREKHQDFINLFWEKYKPEFSSDSIDNETLEALTKIVLYNVIRRRIAIENVRQGVNL